MPDKTAALAQSITKASSKQTYFITKFLVDPDLVNDCYRAYAYFRWADDVIDGTSQSRDERISFIKRQKWLIDRLYRNERPYELSRHEEMLAVLISHDRNKESGLHSFIQNFIALLEFDAYRRDRLISSRELEWYSNSLSRAVTDGIQYFIRNGFPYPTSDDRYQSVIAAHIIHMLRDTISDLPDGFFNISREYLEAHDISPYDVDSQAFRNWVMKRVSLARHSLQVGKRYLESLEVLRCKLAGFWYCARYEGVLNTIERDGFVLRNEYKHNLATLLKIAWIGLTLMVTHIARRVISLRTKRCASQTPAGDPGLTITFDQRSDGRR